MLFKGLGVAMATPFNEKGINYEAAGRLTEFLIQEGANALLPLGTTGEASTITEKDKEGYLKYIIKQAAGRVPVIAGTGSNCTEIAVRNTAKAAEFGADGALVVTPYYNKCTQKGLEQHYKAICSSCNIPVIAYNVPPRTGFNLLPETAYRLCDAGVKGIKEASANMDQILETMRLTAGCMYVYSGDDALTVPVMAMGGAGVISVAGNVIPAYVSRMTRACMRGDFEAAASIQLKILPLIHTLFSEVNPIPLKAALKAVGLDCGDPRLPLTPASEATVSRLESDLKVLEVI